MAAGKRSRNWLCGPNPVGLLLLAVSVLCAPGFAGEVADQTQSLYRVELLLFRHLRSPEHGPEAWPPWQPLSLPANALPLGKHPAGLTPAPGVETGRGAAPQRGGYAQLPPDRLSLGIFAASLARAPDYRLLQHLGWEQRAESGNRPVLLLGNPLLGNPRAPQGQPNPNPDPLPLQSPTEPLEFIGAVQLSSAGALQVTIDLQVNSLASASGFTPPAVGAPPAAVAPSGPRLLGYVLHETRGVRLGEIHYLDHPGFGVLLKVSRAGPGQQAAPAISNQSPR